MGRLLSALVSLAVVAPLACAAPRRADPPAVAPATSSDVPEVKLPPLLDIDDPAREPDVIFWPTPPSVVQKMIEVADVKPTDVVYDLGSGDGRIVIAAARLRGAHGVVTSSTASWWRSRGRPRASRASTSW